VRRSAVGQVSAVKSAGLAKLFFGLAVRTQDIDK
jgi:hypothetical protein